MYLDYSEKTISLKDIVLFVLFLATLNTFNAYYYFVFIAFGFLLCCSNVKMTLNSSSISLFILGLTLVAFSPSYSYSIFGMVKPLTYITCYIIGYSLYEYKRFDTNKSLSLFYKICIFVMSGSFLHYLLNWITNLSYTSRNTVDFWTKTIINATGQAPLACLASSMAIACFFSNVNRKYKIISAIVMLITIGYNLILSGRTLFALVLIVICIAFAHKLITQKNNRFKSIVITVFIILTLIVSYSINLFGVRSSIESTPFYERFFTEDANTELEEDSRIDHKLEYINNASSYLWGGSNLREQYGYAHDIFLDTYDEAGIFAFWAIVVYMFATFFRMIKCVSSTNLPFEFRQVILCIYSILYAQFMVEPIIQGVPWLFASFCIIDGSVTKLLSGYKMNNFQMKG